MAEEIINAKKRLGPQAIQDFKNNQSDDVIVVMYIEDTECFFEKPMKDMRKFFEDVSIEECVLSDDSVINFMTDNKILQILGLDYRWWIAVVRNKKYRRLERLFNDSQETQENVEKVNKVKEKVEKVIKEQVRTEYTCAVADMANDILTNIEIFNGSKKELVNFINRSYQMRTLRSMFRATIMFCINYNESLDLADMKNWSSFEELKEKGVFVE